MINYFKYFIFSHKIIHILLDYRIMSIFSYCNVLYLYVYKLHRIVASRPDRVSKCNKAVLSSYVNRTTKCNAKSTEPVTEKEMNCLNISRSSFSSLSYYNITISCISPKNEEEYKSCLNVN